MAQRQAGAVEQIDGVRINPVQANAVLAILPPEVTLRLQDDFRFFTWDPATGEVRWMCSWDTTESDVDEFAAAIATQMVVRHQRPSFNLPTDGGT